MQRLICSAEQLMPLNETDKSWVREQTRNATQRHGLGKLTGFVKDWSGAGAAAAILVVFFTQWTAYVEFRTKTTDRLDAIEKILPQISATLELLKPHAGSTLPQVMKDSLSSGKSGLGLKTVAALASKAQEEKVPADVRQIAAVGDQLASSRDLFTGKSDSADAWNALTQLLGYYSALSMPPQRATTEYTPTEGQYDFGSTPGGHYEGRIGFGGGLVPIDEAALAEHIVNPKRSSSIREAPRLVIFEADPSVSLILAVDGHHLKNVVLVNAIIEYRGGPVLLENVYFINCVFRFARERECVSFSRSLFASNPVNFKTVG